MNNPKKKGRKEEEEKEETILERGLVGKGRWSVGVGQEMVTRGSNKYQNILYTCIEMP